MTQAWISVAVALQALSNVQTDDVQFVQGVMGRNVTVCLDGAHVKSTFAGKLAFRDATHQWMSFCADVRAPISSGQRFGVTITSAGEAKARVRAAGNIVAANFRDARTADQCAGLQLAVWEAIEDGGKSADFAGGRFMARASGSVLGWAQRYYQDLETPGEALYLQAGGGDGGGQGQLTIV